MQTGVIYVKVRLELNQDIEDSEVDDFVSELDYSFDDPRIQNAEIIESGASREDCP